MDGVTTYTDPSGSFFANIISKNGRNEVQIYPINKDSSQDIIINSSVKKYELPIEDQVIDATWIHYSDSDSGLKKRGSKRKQSEDTETSIDEADSIHLVVLVESSELLIFSPVKNEIVKRVNKIETMKSISASLKSYSVLAINESGNILEISLDSNKHIKTFKFKADSNIQVAESVVYKGNGSTSKSQNTLIGSQNLYLVDSSRSKKSLLIEFPKYSDDKALISFMKQSTINSDRVYVSRRNSNKLFAYNLSNPESYSTFSVSSSNILNLQVIPNKQAKEESLMAITDNGIEVFHVDNDVDHVDQVLVSLIKTNFHEALEQILFTDVFKSDDNRLVGIWHDKNQPQFTNVDWSHNSAGEIIVSIDYNENIDVESDENEEFEFSPDVDQINIRNLSFDKLFKQLSSLLTKSQINDEKIIELCSSNNDESMIKETIQHFATSNTSSTLTNNLFNVISKKIAESPSKKTSLSIWLKWVLVVQGGFISKQPEQYENLKALQGGLNDSMKLIPRLLALQGRLQLLKSQADLRSKMEINDDVDLDETQDISIDESFANTSYANTSYANGSMVEESIVYANGENDDFEESEKHERKDAEVADEKDDDDDDEDDE